MWSILRIQIVLYACASWAPAQPISLKTAEREAVANNATLQAQRYDITAAQADIVSADLPPSNPSLGVNGDILSSPNTFAPEEKQYGVSLAVPLELAGKRSHRVEVAEHGKIVAEEGFSDAVRVLLLTIRSSFYDALYAKAALGLAEQNLASLDSVVSLNRIRLRAKEISESELMRSEVAAEQFRVEVSSSLLDYRKARINLQVAMGRTVADPDVDIEGDLTMLPPSVILTLDDAKRLARESRPDLKGLRASLEREESNQRLQEALGTVDVSVSADYLRQQGVPFYGLSLTVPIPIFNRNQGEILKSISRVEQVRLQLKALELQVDADAGTAWHEYASRKAIEEQMRAGILARSENVRSTIEYAYRRGGTTILDFLDARRTFNDSMRSYYNALTQLHKSVFALTAAIGKEL